MSLPRDAVINGMESRIEFLEDRMRGLLAALDMRDCPYCNGTGNRRDEECDMCSGTGFVPKRWP